MQLTFLTAVTMVAFAANSVLNRAAVGAGGMAALDFAAVRVVSGAVVLAALALVLRRALRFGLRARLPGVAGLAVYLVGFSLAYQRLDAGLGALILFGTVQVTMFAGSLAGGERPAPQRWLGATVALAGLAWLLWPREAGAISLPHAAAMLAAGVGWGIYSLAGRGGGDPLGATAANFVLAAPLVALCAGLGGTGSVEAEGTVLWLALGSGVVASGLGYALWYSVLPRLAGTAAAVAQLTVPVLAVAGGALFLAEPVTPEVVLAGALVLGGVGLSLVPGQRRIGSSGS